MLALDNTILKAVHRAWLQVRATAMLQSDSTTVKRQAIPRFSLPARRAGLAACLPALLLLQRAQPFPAARLLPRQQASVPPQMARPTLTPTAFDTTSSAVWMSAPTITYPGHTTTSPRLLPAVTGMSSVQRLCTILPPRLDTSSLMLRALSLRQLPPISRSSLQALALRLVRRVWRRVLLVLRRLALLRSRALSRLTLVSPVHQAPYRHQHRSRQQPSLVYLVRRSARLLHPRVKLLPQALFQQARANLPMPRRAPRLPAPQAHPQAILPSRYARVVTVPYTPTSLAGTTPCTATATPTRHRTTWSIWAATRLASSLATRTWLAKRSRSMAMIRLVDLATTRAACLPYMQRAACGLRCWSSQLPALHLAHLRHLHLLQYRLWLARLRTTLFTWVPLVGPTRFTVALTLTLVLINPLPRQASWHALGSATWIRNAEVPHSMAATKRAGLVISRIPPQAYIRLRAGSVLQS